MSKPGRNDPCPCGSGKKYKQCCMAQHENASGGNNAPALDAVQALQAGLECHQAGRLAEAERYYRQALNGNPANVDALHFLGVLAHQIRRHAQGAELIEQSIRLDASNPVAHNNLGDAYRALGRFDDAMSSFHKALALKPDFHEVRNNLGETFRAMGRYDEAAACFREVLTQLPEYAAAHNNLGLALQSRGEQEAALACFDNALALRPAYANAHNNRGETLRRLGRAADAQAAYQSALSVNPEFAEAYNNLGLLLREQGKVAEAQAAFDRALALRPDFAEVHNNLGMLIREQGGAREALVRFDRAIALKPDYLDAWCNLVSGYRDLGFGKEALLACQSALRANPAEYRLWLLFADVLRLLPLDALADVDRSMMLAALNKDEVDAQKVERIAVALLMHGSSESQLAAGLERLTAGAAGSQTITLDHALASFLQLNLLLAILEEAIITDYRLENLLTRIRRALLQAAVQPEAPAFDHVITRFVASLAQQCFANEYVFAVSADEENWQAALVETLGADLKAGMPVDAARLMLAACYQPLHRLSFAEKITPTDERADHLQQVILRQLIEPAIETTLKSEIAQLTPVNNAVSQAVRQQYEESPYPRWRKSGGAGAGQSLDGFLHRLFPQQALLCDASGVLKKRANSRLELLVAGCGTGYHAIQAARRFSNADVLAVDLSLGSLAYARRSSEALGIANIEYRQADILQLAALDRQFDVVESCGVLHHMEDPMAGWRVLADLLRPGGVMFIGLYSERARRQVSALRDLIRRSDYPATPDGIRRFRADAMAGSLEIAIGELALSPDFNSTSACRDLLFHVQEHVFTPLKIRDCLDQLKLDFLGFEIPYPEVKRNYLSRFPDNAAADSLENWDAFELDNPHVFSGMYQFWVRKKAGTA